MPTTQQDACVARRAQVQEILDTVFDIACHQAPACADRWRKVQTGIKATLQELWQYNDTRGIKADI